MSRYETSPPDCSLAILAPDTANHGHDYEPGVGAHALIIGDPHATAHVIEGPLHELHDFARRVAGLVGLPTAGAASRQPDVPSVWMLHWWNKHTDHVALFADEDSAIAALAAGVRGDWSSITGYDGVPATPPADDREAVNIYYGDGDSPFHDDDGYDLAPTAVHRTPKAPTAPGVDTPHGKRTVIHAS